MLEVDGVIATIRLHRPDAGNAIDVALAEALLAAVEKCGADAAVRSVILTGAGRMFCAGGDVQAFAAAGDAVGALIGRITSPLHRAIGQLAALSKSIVTAVNGAAAGAGLGLAMLGDVAIAGRSAKFAAGYVELGFTPDAGVSWLLPRLVGLREAQRLLFEGKRINADEAVRIGLISSVVRDDELMKSARIIAERLSQGAAAHPPALHRCRILARCHEARRQRDADARGLTPLIWFHISPYDTFDLDMDQRLDLDLKEAA